MIDALTPSRSAPSFFNAMALQHVESLYVDKDACASFYTPGLPEENVYHLCNKLVEAKVVSNLNELTVLFISSHNKETHLWTLSSPSPLNQDTGLLITDYHVILLQRTSFQHGEFDLTEPGARSPLVTRLHNPDSLTYVWDLESNLGFPTRLAVYAQHALRTKHVAQMGAKYARLFRAVPAESFMRNFCSERKHLPRRQDNTWVEPKPKTSPIKGPARDTMHRYLDMMRAPLPTSTTAAALHEEALQWGVVMEEDEMLTAYGAGAAAATRR